MANGFACRAALAIAVATVGVSSFAWSAEQGTSMAGTAAPAAPAPSTIDQIKQPVDWFKWGFDFRWRQEYYNNAATLDDDAVNSLGQPVDNETNYQRYRARVWYSLLPTDNLAFNNRWAWEGRYYWQPSTRDGFDQNYIIADQLNVQIKNLGGDKKNVLTVGRQDIILFDGWLMFDGSPLDGSRTLFFDAARLQYQFDANSGIDVAVLATHADPQKWLPVIMTDGDTLLTEQNEHGGYINYQYRPSKVTRLDPYFIYKANDAVAANGDEGEIYTLGGRVEHGFTDNISGRLEGAYEFGRNRNIYTPSQGDLQAFGLNSRATYAFKDSMDNKLHLSAEYLSGDDPDTDTNEAFDALWGRWPRFSEVTGPLQATETRAFDYTNLFRVGPTWEISPTQKLSFSSSYYALFANERTYETAAYGDGYFRGHVLQAIVRYKFAKNLTGAVWGEYFIPGDYYSDSRQDNAAFVRAELSYTF